MPGPARPPWVEKRRALPGVSSSTQRNKANHVIPASPRPEAPYGSMSKFIPAQTSPPSFFMIRQATLTGPSGRSRSGNGRGIDLHTETATVPCARRRAGYAFDFCGVFRTLMMLQCCFDCGLRAPWVLIDGGRAVLFGKHGYPFCIDRFACIRCLAAASVQHPPNAKASACAGHHPRVERTGIIECLPLSH